MFSVRSALGTHSIIITGVLYSRPDRTDNSPVGGGCDDDNDEKKN